MSLARKQDSLILLMLMTYLINTGNYLYLSVMGAFQSLYI